MTLNKADKISNPATNTCPVTYCMGIIGGKWKPILLYLLSMKVSRFGIMLRGIEGISKQMLTKQLRELEADGVVHRKVYPVVPPRVEYSLTDKGKSLLPIISEMRKWGEPYIEQSQEG